MSYSFDYVLFMMCPTCTKLKAETKSKCPINKAMSLYVKAVDGENLKKHLRMVNGTVQCKEYEKKVWESLREKKEKEESEKLLSNSETMAMKLDVDNNIAEQQETQM